MRGKCGSFPNIQIRLVAANRYYGVLPAPVLLQPSIVLFTELLDYTINRTWIYHSIVIGIGPFAVVSNAGELFVEHGLSIKRRSPFPHTVIAELTNDLIMYQPTREAFEEQGYETLVGPNRISIEGIESIVETSIDMLVELRRNHEQ